ncbi:MAG: single-stranded DNA-binding protein [candidate division KSB1 bacterium]|nr:single-stranded DNA-binding protein [candidate division KSB1 bacterium]MDZ7274778.1 single-stranded DNA-binding protein [candidate division KSB1 bacterium]MDZ7285602.1 single-stranded DNA-binding protein [candidate division KSB1 bacterium]MDZ7298634.1 single-stranded DNA-binding protein [candidate division KSB1 bacterium]MDZ7307644.1 single-stranded DNA-binding protein [candidate division KSB1 bacterium]
MAELKMPDINTVMIAGNLTSDPSFRRTTNGTPVANFYIASNRRFKDNTGQWRENVCYVGVVAWYKLAESCAENLHKSSAVLVDGELQSRIWKNEDGTTRNVVEIKARRIQFLNRRSEATEATASDDEFESAPEEHHDAPARNQSEATPPPANPAAKSEFNFGYDNLKL